MSDYTLSVKVTGDAEAFTKSVKQAQEAFTRFKEKMKKPFSDEMWSVTSKRLQDVGSQMEKVGGKLTKCITAPALGATTALAGMSLAKGWGRMTQIDNAKIKLKALGLTADEVGAITENALASVRGTAYGLDDAMSVASSAFASGIKEGEQMEKYLTAIANASAIAGIGMGEMGQIFNKVASQGKAQNDVLQQMAERGIPIYQWLADEMNTTADAVFEMASAGKIGLKEFQSAVEAHVEGSAKTIGSETITGAISNVNASISRMGANLLGSADDANSFAGRVLPMLNSLMKAMDVLEGKAKLLGQAFGQAVGPAMDKLTALFEAFGNGESKIDAMQAKVGALAGAFAVTLGPALTMVGKLAVGMGLAMDKASAIGNVFGKSGAQILKMGGFIGIAVSAFAIAYARSEQFRNAINRLVLAVGGVLKNVFTALAPVLETVMGLFAYLATELGTALAPVIDAVAPLITALGEAFSALIQLLAPLLTVVAKVAGGIIKAFLPVVSFVLGQFVGGISNGLTTALNIVTRVATGIKKAFNFSAVVSKVASAFNAIKAKMISPITTAQNKISSMLKKLKSKFPMKIGKIFTSLRLPSISVSGGKAPFGIAGKGSLPKFHVNWHAQGGVFNRPTLLPSLQGAVHGMGEAGKEAIAPISTLQKYVTTAVVNGISAQGMAFDYERFANVIVDALAGVSVENVMTMDKKAVARAVGSLVRDEINALDKRNNRKLGIV